jgi:pilus assembly protein FimV
MRLRPLLLAAAALLAVLAQPLAAMGLGDLVLHSRLNQPFSAEVRLQNTRGLTEGDIKVTFASQDEFERRGLEWHYFLTDFRFEVEFVRGEQPRILIRSHSPIREPYISFILEVRSPSSKVQREYTVLLEKPEPIE